MSNRLDDMFTAGKKALLRNEVVDLAFRGIMAGMEKRDMAEIVVGTFDDAELLQWATDGEGEFLGSEQKIEVGDRVYVTDAEAPEDSFEGEVVDRLWGADHVTTAYITTGGPYGTQPYPPGMVQLVSKHEPDPNEGG